MTKTCGKCEHFEADEWGWCDVDREKVSAGGAVGDCCGEYKRKAAVQPPSCKNCKVLRKIILAAGFSLTKQTIDDIFADAAPPSEDHLAKLSRLLQSQDSTTKQIWDVMKQMKGANHA